MRLEKRRFFVKAGDKAAVKITPPSNLADGRNCVSREAWKVELAKQKKLYYRRIEDHPALAPAQPAPEPAAKESEAPRAAPPKPNLEFI